MRIAIGHYTATSAAGIGLNAMHQSIAGMRSGLIQNDLDGCDLETWVGRVPSLEDTALPPHLAHLESRNNRLAWLSLQQDGFPSRFPDSSRTRRGVWRVRISASFWMTPTTLRPRGGC